MSESVDSQPAAPTEAARIGFLRDGRIQLLALFGGALLLRLVLALVVLPDSGHRSDLAILAQWANELAQNGPGAFYRPDSGYFADYPPTYLYVLWATGIAGSWLSAGATPEYSAFTLKLPYILADLAAAWFLLLLVRRTVGPAAGVKAAALFLFNPAIILISTIWGQNDPVATAAVLATTWLIATDRLAWAASAACVAMLVKFQYGFMVPIVGIVLIRRELLGAADRTAGWRRVARVGAAALVTTVVICLPFGLLPIAPGDPAHSLAARFVAASAAFPGLTQNAFNLWMNPIADIILRGASGLTEGHVVDDTTALVAIGSVGLSAQWLGNVLFLAATGLALLVLRRRDDGLVTCFVALTIAVAFFALPTRIHERYLYPAIALAIPFLWARTRGWWLVFIGVSVVLFLDAYWVYTLPIGNAGPGRGLLADTFYSPAGIYLLSLVPTVILAWLLWQTRRPELIPVGLDIVMTGRAGAEPDVVADPLPSSTRLPPDGAQPRRAIRVSRTGPVPIRRWSTLVPTAVALAVLALVAAIWAARILETPGRWLWNLDMPKIDYPLAVFANQAITSGHLPLWTDRLGLGYPLYAEGQVAAFYPPSWLVFRLEPITALDVYRVVHLAWAGLGAGLLVLRLRGSRPGAVIAVLVAVLGGGIVAKLEWHNLVASYAWLPWVLLPLVRRPRPTRAGLVASGVCFGIQALAGHPNTWLLTGITAGIVLLAGRDGLLAGLRRALGVGLLGAAMGAVQLVPTALLTTLSVRGTALSPNDLFASASTPFDILAFAFQGAFARLQGGSWDRYSNWYPDGAFALLEVAAYVGLPALGLVVGASRLRRARPLLIAIIVLIAIPIVEALRPEILLSVPLLNGLRSPVRAYLPASLLLGVLAGMAVGRLPRLGMRPVPVAIGVAVPAAAYALTLAVAVLAPDAFNAVAHAFTTFGSVEDVAAKHNLALSALQAPWPLLIELAAGAGIALLAIAAARNATVGSVAAPVAVALVAIPLLLFGPAPNGSAPIASFTSKDSDFVRAMQSANPRRMLTINPPGWYAGMPNQPAAAGLPDLRMFSSLNLRAVDGVTEAAAKDEPAAASLRRALGVDVVAKFDAPCPGTQVATSDPDKAVICRDDAATRPPYWIPLAAATPAPAPGNPLRPQEAAMDVGAVLASAVPLEVAVRDMGRLQATVAAPADGWVWIDRAWWPGWTTSVDGQPVETLQALGGQLVRVPAGTHEVAQVLVPWDALAGLAVGALALAFALAWVWRDRTRHRDIELARPPGDRASRGDDTRGTAPPADQPLGSTTIVTSDVMPE